MDYLTSFFQHKICECFTKGPGKCMLDGDPSKLDDLSYLDSGLHNCLCVINPQLCRLVVDNCKTCFSNTLKAISDELDITGVAHLTQKDQDKGVSGSDRIGKHVLPLGHFDDYYKKNLSLCKTHQIHKHVCICDKKELIGYKCRSFYHKCICKYELNENCKSLIHPWVGKKKSLYFEMQVFCNLVEGTYLIKRCIKCHSILEKEENMCSKENCRETKYHLYDESKLKYCEICDINFLQTGISINGSSYKIRHNEETGKCEPTAMTRLEIQQMKYKEIFE